MGKLFITFYRAPDDNMAARQYLISEDGTVVRRCYPRGLNGIVSQTIPMVQALREMAALQSMCAKMEVSCHA